MIQTLTTRDPEETEAIGFRWGEEAAPGWIFGLKGDLGAGKTQLVKGIARGLGIAARVLSPTFALVHQYVDGRLPLYHIDLYRLENEAAIRSAGLDQFVFQRTGVTVIEWIERWPMLSDLQSIAKQGPGLYRHAELTQVTEFERRIESEDFGA
jgi:tRNA threonylcarbamoyladenosine biosynthesis protein TsaE